MEVRNIVDCFGLRPPGDQDVQPGPHRAVEEPRCLGAQAAELDQVGQPGRAEHELADVDRTGRR